MVETNHTQERSNLHAIVLLFPLQGHLNPAVSLGLKLASKGMTITFLSFEHIHQLISPSHTKTTSAIYDNIFDGASRESHGLDIRYRIISDGLPMDYDRVGSKLMEALWWYLNGGLYDQVEKGVREIMFECKPKVTVLIADTFFPWVSKISRKFGIPYASFWTEPALVFDIYYHVHLLRQHRHLDCPDARTDPIDYIPGVKSIQHKDLMSYLKEKDTSSNMHKMIFEAYQDVRSANYVLCNTAEELESDTISALQEFSPFYPIGPLFLPESTKSVVPTSLWAESNCSEWLNSKPDGSVLYVSFGSLANFTKKDVTEMAYGLMDSNVDFIWVLRPKSVLDDANDQLPRGFEEGVCGRGIVVPWTNQLEVLIHRAIGGFLTHCGWNSVIESIWCEIPMLCFPVFSDQFPNRKLVVDDWKIGLNLCNENAMKREEIATHINNFVSKNSKDTFRNNISNVKSILQKALEADGSSEKYINRFIQQLSK